MNYQFKNVLIALDDSELSKKAFDRAVHIAKRDEANLVLAHVIDTQNFSIIKSVLDNLNEVYEKSEEEIKEKFNEYEKKAENAGVKNIKKVIKFGTPKNVLIDEIIPEENIDLAVLGATGVSGLERVFLGSVAENVFRHTKSKVLVVR